MTSSGLENPLRLLPTHNPIFNAGVASAVSNICGTTTSHPLDTIRVRMQLERRKVSATHMLKNTIRLEGIKGLYKGLSQPLMGAVPVKAIGFTATDYIKKELRKSYPQMSTT